jgi:hypothetical protein
MFYDADTKEGSSGAPCFNVNWLVAALPHQGVARTRNNPNDPDKPFILLKDGSVWDEKPSTRHLIDYISNRGIRISSIVSFLQELPLSEAQNELFADNLELPAAVSGEFNGSEFNESYRQSSQEIAKIVRESDGSVSCHLRVYPKNNASNAG